MVRHEVATAFSNRSKELEDCPRSGERPILEGRLSEHFQTFLEAKVSLALGVPVVAEQPDVAEIALLPLLESWHLGGSHLSNRLQAVTHLATAQMPQE